MRAFTIHGSRVAEIAIPTPDALEALPGPHAGFLWLSFTRTELAQWQLALQSAVQRLCDVQLVDLHISDLLNQQLPSRFDYTSQYDLLVFHRLGEATPTTDSAGDNKLLPSGKRGPTVLRRLDTHPVGFAVLDQMLLSVHPDGCSLRDSYAQRLLAAGGGVSPATAGATPDARSAGARGVPGNSADLMLRMVNHMVDGFLSLRRELTHQLDHWQTELLNPKARFANWSTLLDARQALHKLDEICDDQRSAIQDWIEALKNWPQSDVHLSHHERDLLQVRSRDVLEHIDRVVHHVRQLEQNAETAVQIHFNAQSHRTNEVMRTLTVLTAVFLPLNLIAGIFGMNFEFIPLLHRSNGFWLAVGTMALTAFVLVVFFWRKRYLERSAR
ncbi:MAG: magnesium transporter CorA [Rhodoferax ferrireducens]|uniref:Magnesium transporter CorA n=1 Tax=Rhodoferax ferrireducens TaxID=192843 RepID=A0A1W9KPZ7_9BURK|nr:MAG: magnesium transporter CorA [Rhodoferax ferrireducens]